MPLNACSINSDSVDSICHAKRAKYIEILFGEPPVEDKKGSGGYTGYYPDFNTNSEEKLNPLELEHLYITITTTLDGETVISHFDNSPTDIRPLIAINKLTSNNSNVSVNIRNITIGKSRK